MPVPDRSAKTLLQRHLTKVYSDSWAAYRDVQQLSAVVQHQMVNHRPVTGVRTQNVESYWNRVKTKFKRMKGVLLLVN